MWAIFVNFNMKVDVGRVANNFKRFVPTRSQAKDWRIINDIPEYVNASYVGKTGQKAKHFPTTKRASAPDITDDLTDFETEVLQELKDAKGKPFGFIRCIHKFLKNFGTGDAWDTKFHPLFPGRDNLGRKQYATYNNEIVSGNDISNLFYAHVCKYMGIPMPLAKLCAKLDAKGVFELLSKGKLPNKELRHFKDTACDQIAIEKGAKEFDINKYKLK